MKHEAINNARRKINETLKREDERIVVGWRPGLEEKREEGERWTDSNGTEWEMKNGFKQKVTKLQTAKTPWFCPVCEGSMSHDLDTKFWRLRGKCFDCVIKDETEMVRNGTWDEFQKDTMRKNYIAALKDTIKELEHGYKFISAPEFIYADDEKILMTQRWNVDIDEVKKEILEEIDRLNALLEEAENYFEKKSNE